MIKSIAYKARFTETDRVLEGNLTFGTGLTAITGPNETGKSFVIEMIRYALFGSAALRGVASDYYYLTAILNFKDYLIERSLKNAKITQAGEVLAIGTKPVNAKVLSILGFGLDVFDISCVCNQGDVERLGAMLPTDRKRMVDRVIGVDRIDEVQKWSADQGSLLAREIEVLERKLVEPEQPDQPLDWQPVADLEARLATLRPLRDEWQQLQGWLSAVRAPPVPPESIDITETAEALEAELAHIQDVESQRRHICSLPVIDFDPVEVRAQWADYDFWCERQAFEARYPRPEIASDAYGRLLTQAEIRSTLKGKRANLGVLRNSPMAVCPCGKEFYLADQAQSQIDQLMADIQTLELRVSGDEINNLWLIEQAERLDAWARPDILSTWERLHEAKQAPLPTVSREDLGKATAGITSAERDARLTSLSMTRSLGDVAQELKLLNKYTAEKQAYDHAVVEYGAWALERDRKATRANGLSNVSSRVEAIESQLRTSSAYDRLLERYHDERATFDALVTEIKAKEEELAGWKAARAALTDLRTRIKTYLVPSLSKVASHLLTQMTGGARSLIVVDENFDVTVDGQRLDTLSGSGKASANLALRIGLGQVLTNNIMSLFIGDEIDASMDADRASYLHSCIRQLSGQISQLLLITHKVPVADTVITLGENFDDAGRVYSGGAEGH